MAVKNSKVKFSFSSLTLLGVLELSDHLQFLFLILSKFEQIIYLLLPLKLSENYGFLMISGEIEVK